VTRPPEEILIFARHHMYILIEDPEAEARATTMPMQHSTGGALEQHPAVM
jgi:hypothetical protein